MILSLWLNWIEKQVRVLKHFLMPTFLRWLGEDSGSSDSLSIQSVLTSMATHYLISSTPVESQNPNKMDQTAVPRPSEDSAVVENVPPAKKQETTSKIWQHFSKKDAEGSKEPKAVCNSCKTQLSGKSSSGTQHLWCHLEWCKDFQSSNRSSKQSLLVASKGVMNQTTRKFLEKKT